MTGDQPNPATSIDGDLASAEQRAAAWILDAMLSVIVIAPFVVVMAALGYLGPEGKIDPAPFTALVFLPWLIAMGLAIYFDGSRGGATPGQMLLGIRVADQENRGPIGYRRATVRQIIYLLGGWCFYLGWLWGLWDRRRQTWHDKAAHSLVIRGPDRRWSVLSAILLWVAVVLGTSALINLIQGHTQSALIYLAATGFASIVLGFRVRPAGT